ncbi:hypothetical protein G7Y89_g1106 [Cudoniella acicularis]|uniref:Uncharacterized protein n=1 Tax=Cudoniella acicularis TaxID=354080 RepID=A0A8H4RXI8_9HELO|nr:hypothetical protein G7Y89_g1106 [Cudoniella acicularis]
MSSTTFPSLEVFHDPNTPPNQLATLVSPTTQFWWEAGRASFSTLLQKCQYSPFLQDHYLRLFQLVTIHFPSPFSARKTKLKAGEGAVYELSWNYDSATSDSIMRFSFDIFGSPRALIKQLAAQGFLKPRNADLRLLDSAWPAHRS